MDQKRWTNPQHSTQHANVPALRIAWPRLEVILLNNKPTTHNKTKTMKPQDKNTIAELVALLSQAIDIIREYNGEDDADYLEKEMQK